MQKYFIPQKPVLLKGLADLQSAGKKWTIDWFKETMGDYQISVFDFNKPRHKYSTVVDPDSKMLFRDFLDLISRDEPSSIRMFRYDLLSKTLPCARTFPVPPSSIKGSSKGWDLCSWVVRMPTYGFIRCLSVLLGKRYNDWKQKKCIQRVEQAIYNAEKLKSDEADFYR